MSTREDEKAMRAGVGAAVSLIMFLCVAGAPEADDSPPVQLPSALLELGTGGSSYALVVDKSLSRLDVYRKLENEAIVQVASFRASTGLNGGDKMREGDERTPEGIYYFVRIREDNELLSKYGLRAFDMNYPNHFDRLEGKNGHGIWLHATDEPERLNEPRTTLGCVVVSNEDIRELSRYITLYRTPIIISERLNRTAVNELKRERVRIEQFITRWLDAWAKQDFNGYDSCYGEQFRGGGGARTAWFERKRGVFNATGWAQVEVADLKIFRWEGEFIVSFFQRYRSNLMDDTGIKWIYLVNAPEGLKIVGEDWFPVGKAVSGQRWGESNPRLSSVIEDLHEITLERSGRLALAHPQYTIPGLRASQPEEQPAEEVVKGKPVIIADDFQVLAADDRRIEFSMKLSNGIQDGKRLRGWMFLVARWEGGAGFTAFPDISLTNGRPPRSSNGDSFGIRWFKVVRGTLAKPSPEARLAELRCLAFARDGRLLLDAPIAVRLP
jgi:murein L,D-transpeptidase YafK